MILLGWLCCFGLFCGRTNARIKEWLIGYGLCSPNQLEPAFATLPGWSLLSDMVLESPLESNVWIIEDVRGMDTGH